MRNDVRLGRGDAARAEIAAEGCPPEKAGGRYKCNDKSEPLGREIVARARRAVPVRIRGNVKVRGNWGAASSAPTEYWGASAAGSAGRRGGNWMVLEPSIAGWGTRLGSSLYSAWVRLDNLGRCVDFAADAGDGWVSSGEHAGTRMFLRAHERTKAFEKSSCGRRHRQCVSGT